MQHTQHLADLMSLDADPLERAAHFAACDFYDHCFALGLPLPNDLARTRKYFRHQLSIRREFHESAERDRQPVVATPISSPGYVLGWVIVLATVAGLAAAWFFGKR